ncbi:MAG: hypothetical protein NTX86_05265 [Candidatus Dependentiae bacterium]|nr:hypothetical protein [Candidatus Dependentiae bacterium]
MEKNKGIVLKTYLPQKCKIVVLDNEIGKIVVVPNRQDISYGACIMYSIREQHNCSFIYDIELIDSPLCLGKDDILFVHHILELCYYFIPAQSSVSPLFNLLILLYESRHVFEDSVVKKLFLFKFFTTLGFYPEGQRFQTPYFHILASTSIDNLIGLTIDLKVEQELDFWLLHCISLHPCINNFKTVSFLHNNRAV